LAKLGFIADLISKPVRVGYMAGLAITIFIGQLPKLFGYSVDANGILQELSAFLKNLDQTNLWTLTVGLLCLIIILSLKRWAPRIPGVLVAVVFAIVVTSFFNLAAKGVDTIGVLPQGFPRPSFPSVDLSVLPLLVATAFGISLVAVGDTISVSTGFASRGGYEVDSDQELVGVGSANILASLFQGFPVTTSSSRTAVAEQAGAKSQLTGVFAAVLVLIMLLFIPGLVQNMPQSALAAIIITASISLFDVVELRRLWLMRKSEFVLAVISILGVALVGVLQGIVIAVVISIFLVFRRAWSPYAAVLGKPEDIPGYHDITRHPNASQIPGLLMIRWEAPLFFANANLFRNKIRTWIKQTVPPPVWVVIAAAPVTDIDTTAGEMLVDLDLEMNAAGIHMIFAELRDSVKDKIERYGVLETVERRHFYETIDEAVAAFEREVQSRKPPE
jgi:high affinity sulfate transporter 1